MEADEAEGHDDLALVPAEPIGELVAQEEPQLIELPHAGMHRLRLFGTKQVLEHVVTGECVDCPSGAQWSLALSPQGRAYIHAADRQPQWVACLLRTSVWQRGERFLLQVVGGGPGGKDLIEWVDDITHRQRLLRVPLHRSRGTLPLPTIEAKVHLYFLARADAFAYWAIKSFAGKVALHVKDTTEWYKKNMVRVWGPMLLRSGIPADHVQLKVPSGAKSGAEVLDDLAVHDHQVSTHALLVLLMYWHTRIGHVGTKDSCRATLEALCLMLPSACNLPIGSGLAGAPPHVAVQQGKLQAAPGLQGHVAGSAHWPRDAEPIADVLLLLFSCDACQRVLRDLVYAIAAEVELRLKGLPEPTSQDLAKLADPDSRSIDLQLRLAIAGTTRNKWTFGRAAKQLDVRVGLHSAKTDHCMQYRYMLAATKAMHSGKTWATTLDGTRFSGKDYYQGFIMNMDTKKCAWLPPQVVVADSCPRFWFGWCCLAC